MHIDMHKCMYIHTYSHNISICIYVCLYIYICMYILLRTILSPLPLARCHAPDVQHALRLLGGGLGAPVLGGPVQRREQPEEDERASKSASLTWEPPVMYRPKQGP